ncbi:MAG: insulinase family protein, partial [Candidatus Eisenbacteria bacterium]
MSRRREIRALAAALATACALLALAGSAVSGTLRLPPVTRARLPNGLTVLVVPTHRLPLVDLRLVVRAGSVNDPPGKEGLADLTTSLMTQGAAGRDARAIAEDIAFVGGSLDASASTEQIVVTCEVLRKDF